MLRTCLIIFALHLALAFQGCAILEHFDGSSKEQTKASKMTKEQMRGEIERLESENEDLKKQADINKSEIQRLSEQIDKQQKQNKTLEDENRTLSKKLVRLQLKYETLSSAPHKLKKDIQELKIKVLSGYGNISSAQKMTKNLIKMGYKARLFGHASRSDFLQHTIYFAPEYRKEAQRLALRLDNNAIVKPLTWPSMFSLIVVTGKNP